MNAQSFIDAGLHYKSHSFTVPLDHQDLSKGTINVFARSVCLVGDKDSKQTMASVFSRRSKASLLLVQTETTAGSSAR